MCGEMSPRAVFDCLPDELLVLIVSHLPFKEAARTSVLAKRWTGIWAHTANIELNQSFFTKSGQNVVDLLRKEGPRALAPFADFATKFLNSYKGRNISSFRLVLGEHAVFLGAMLYHYVKFAFSRHVRHLTIDLTQPIWRQRPQPFSPRPIIRLPDQFYQHCDRYESLHLSGVKISLSNCNNFTALQSVSLGWVQLEDDDLQNLAAEAPCLQELRLKNCWGFDVEIQSSSLKILVVEKCNLDQDAVSVVAPNLKMFVYSGLFGDINFNGAVGSLEEVYIDFDLEEDFDHYWTLIYNQFLQFKNVRVLQVCSFVLQILPFIYADLLPVNPKHLIMKTASFHPNDFHGLEYFLYSCQSVEVLTVDVTDRLLLNDYECPMMFEPGAFWEMRNGKPAECLEKSLKVVEVRGFGGTRHQVLFLQLIMYLGKMLEHVVLFKQGAAQQEVEEGYQLLLQSQKSSANLRITCV